MRGVRSILVALVLTAACSGEEGEPMDAGDGAVDGDGDGDGDGTPTDGGTSAASDMSTDDGDPGPTPATSGADSSDTAADGSTTDPDPTNTDTSADGDPPALQECLDEVAAVEFDASPPNGQTKVPGLGDCVSILDGESLYNYHCIWCHSDLSDNDINDRTAERIEWAVDLSEGNNNWPDGDLSLDPMAQDRILEAILASPEPVTNMHPHPLPEYL